MKYIYYTVVLTQSERDLLNELVMLEMDNRDRSDDAGRFNACLSIVRKLDDEPEEAWLTPPQSAKAR